MIKQVIIGSGNPVKVGITKEVFSASFDDVTFDFVSHSAPSGVPDQPIGQEQTKLGALNRAKACVQECSNADFFVGLEGGIEKIDGEYWAFAWMCIIDHTGKEGFGSTGSFLLPPRISILIDEGNELGVAADIVFDETNSKHKGGTIGLLTDGQVTRADFYRNALVFALIPFLKEELY